MSHRLLYGEFSIGKILLFSLQAQLFYLKGLFFPFSFNIFPQLSHPFAGEIILGLAVLGGVIFLGIFLFRRSADGCFALLFSILVWVPVSNILIQLPAPLPEIWFPVAERWLYLPSFGFCYLLAAGWVYLWNRPLLPRRIALAAFLFVLLGAYGFTTYQRNPIYQNDIAFFGDAVQKTPASYVLRYNLAVALEKKGRLKEAEQYFQDVLRLKPEHAGATAGLGNMALARGQWTQAISFYEHALALDASMAGVHNNLGAAFFRMGLLEESVSAFRQALAIAPDHPEARHNLNSALAALKKGP